MGETLYAVPFADVDGDGLWSVEGVMLFRERYEADLACNPVSYTHLGVPKRTIQDWGRKGVDHATVGNLKKVTGVLGCRIDDLL